MLERILDNQNPFWRFMSKMFDLAVLSILWLLVSLPVFTMGAATTALFAVCFQMIREKETGSVNVFWRSLKENFKQATGMWLILLAVVGMLVFDLWYFTAAQNYLSDTAAMVIGGLLAVILLIVLMIAVMAFALLSLFDNTARGTLTNALILVLRHPARAILAVAIDVGMVAFSIYALFWLPMISVVLTLIGAGLAVFFNTLLLFPLFRSALPEDPPIEEEPLAEDD